MDAWVPTRARPVDLAEVEAATVEVCRAYKARLFHDPWQAARSAQTIRAGGVLVKAWTFSASSVGQIGGALHVAIRNRRLRIGDDEHLIDELASVRLKPSTVPGQVRLDHAVGAHDDRAVVLGMLTVLLDSDARRPPATVTTTADIHLGQHDLWRSLGVSGFA